jgi:peptide/nickel transport system substrate-binding protein
MMKHYRWVFLCVALATVLSLAGCAPAQPAAPAASQPAAQEQPAAGGANAITISFFEEPNSLNFAYSSMWFANIVSEIIERGLWVYDDKQQFVPELALEVPSRENGGISEDGQTITVHLRQGVRWHDGQPVTSADVKFTYDAIMNPKNTVDTRYPYADYVDSVETPDDYTVVIHTKAPFAGWWTMFQYLLPKHILGDLESLDNADYNRAPIGFGPYKFKEWVPGDHITLEKNADYWRGVPKVDTIYFKIVPSSEAQMAAIQAGGQVDIGVFQSYDEVPVLEKLGTVDVKAIYYAYNEHYFFNLDPQKGHPALQDERVRRAIAMSINREQIATTLLQGLTQPAHTFWDGTAYANQDIPVIPYDPQGAAKLLDEAGWTDHDGDGIRDKDGQKFSFIHKTTAGRKIREDALIAVQQMLKDQGIDMVIENVPYDIFFEGYGNGGPIYTGQYDMAGWSDGSYPDPGSGAYYWLCDQIPSDENPTGGNFELYCDKDMDVLLRQQDTTVDTQARKTIFDRIEQMMYDKTLTIPMWNDPDLWSVNKRLANVRIGGWTPFWNIHEWEVGS